MTVSSLPYRLFVGIDIAAKKGAVSWMTASSIPSRGGGGTTAGHGRGAGQAAWGTGT